MTDESIRASDDDRERVVTALREAYTEGRLTLDEFEERTSAGYAARTWGELRTLTEDLPSPPVLGTQQQGEQRPARELDAGAVPTASVPPMPRVGPDLMRATQRRPRPFGRLLPVVLIWAVIAAAAGASHLAVVLAVVFVAVLGIRALSGTRW
jgi:hypothetical protein